MQKAWLGWSCFVTMGAFALCPASTLAQLTPDNTLGAESSVITNIDQLRERIEGGAIRGANLFHSFLEFNVGEGRAVYFANPAGIENILSRVTGGNPSHILGRLGVLGGANLFLINPNGIIFGANASLDIQGSFFATTADGIKLGEEGFFSATNPQESRLLSVNPGALFFNQAANQAGNIINRGNLAVGKDLTLAAGNLDLQGQLFAGGNLTLQGLNGVQIRDSVANPFIAAAKGNLLIQGNQSIDIFALNHPESGLFSGGDLLLRSANTVGGDAHFWSGGSFRIENLDGSLGSLYSPNDPIIRSLGDVSFYAYQGASLHILTGGSVNINTIIIDSNDTTNETINPINTPQLSEVILSNGSQITIDGSVKPTLDIRAGMQPDKLGIPLGTTGNNGLFFDEFINIINSPINNPTLPTRADIKISDVYFNASDGIVLLTNQYKTNTSLNGDIIINPTLGYFGYGIDVRSSRGNGGEVIIDSRNNVTIKNGVINTTSIKQGNAGDILIRANDNISIINSLISSNIGSSSGSEAVGNVGTIKLEGKSVSLTNGSQLQAGFFPGGTGEGGLISIQGTDSVYLDDTAVFANSEAGAVGNSSQIELSGRTISLTQTLLNANNGGQGNGGDVTLSAQDEISLKSASRIFSSGLLGGNIILQSNGAIIFKDLSVINSSSYTSVAETKGGDINITSQSLLLTGGSQINSETLGAADTGKIMITAEGNVRLEGLNSSAAYPNAIFSIVKTGAEGNSRGIEINTGSLILADGAEISAPTYDKGNGGEINITATDRISLTDGAQINVNTFSQGNAGAIKITATNKIALSGEKPSGNNSGIYSQVIAAAEGNAGIIEINTHSLKLTDGAQINASTYGKGNGGAIKITATDTVSLAGEDRDGLSSAILNQVYYGAEGSAGGIEVNTNSLSLTDGSIISSSTFSQGNAGKIKITATDTISLAGESSQRNISQIFSTVAPRAMGNAGQIEINTNSLFLSDGAQINTGTFGRGKTGELKITATDTISLSGSDSLGLVPTGIFSKVQSEAAGNSERIEINTGSLFITDGAQISASTNSQGNAGEIKITATDAISLTGESSSSYISGIFSTVGSNVIGNAGGIDIQTGSLTLTNGAQIVANTRGKGDAGQIKIAATDTISLSRYSSSAIVSGIFSQVNTGAEGNSQGIEINGKSLFLTDGAQISAITQSKGNAGSITVTTRDTVLLDGVGANEIPSAIVTLTQGEGNAGDLTVTTGKLIANNGGILYASTFGKGDGGKIKVEATEQVSFTGSKIFNNVGSSAEGNSGGIEIITGTLSLTDQSTLFASTDGQGNAGDVLIRATNQVFLSNSEIFTDVGQIAVGKGGNITIETGSLFLTNNATLFAPTKGQGNAGNISILATEDISLSGGQIYSQVENTGIGNGGNISLITDSLRLSDRAVLFANTQNQGNAGNIFIQASQSVSLTNSTIFSAVETQGIGQGGNISLTTRALSLTDGSVIDNSTSGRGNAGNIQILATEATSLTNLSSIGATVEPGGIGNGGNIQLQTNSLALTDRASIAATTWGQGNAGTISLGVDRAIYLSNSSTISNSVLPGGIGNGSDINITARSLTLTDGGQIESRVFGEKNLPALNLNLPGGQGKGGNIRINASDFVSISGVRLSDVIFDGINLGGKGESSGLFANTERGASGTAGSITVTTKDFRLSDGAVVNTLTANSGDAGNITINANTFEATGGGQIISATDVRGNAGNIALNIRDNTTISGFDPNFSARIAQFGEDIVNNQGSESGLFVNTAPNSTGQGGNINIQTRSLNLANRAQISAKSQGQGNAGNININANGLLNATDSDITTSAQQTSGGAITITAQDIRLYGDSDIRTNVASGAGGGGDITLTAHSLIAYDDSDILAFARDGRGGNITLDTPIFFGEGFQPAPKGTDPNTLDGNNHVDINASGAISGIIILPDLTFIRNSLTDLPENLINTENLIANSCVVRNRQKVGTFIITGAGGLPVRPGDASVSPYPTGTVQTIPDKSASHPWKFGDPIVEPQGVYRLGNGEVVLSRECQ
jgi:filamentous hemagglutinin family protein